MKTGGASASDLVLRPRKLHALVYALICLAFTVTGAFMIAGREWTGWFVAGFFGLGGAVLLVSMLPGASYLRLRPEGFTLCSLYWSHRFRWADVGPFFPGAVSGRKMVLFGYSDPGTRPRWRALARVLTGGVGALPNKYGMTVEGLADLMNDWRENMYATGETTGPKALSLGEISRRLPIWEAISDLWLDTEHGESGLRFIADRLAVSGYSLAELEDIYLVEVAPVVHVNLRQVAGEWAGFNSAWLERAVLRHLADPHHRARALRQEAHMTELVAEDWREVKRQVAELRQPGPEA